MKIKSKQRLFRKTTGWYIFSKIVHFYLRLFYKQIVIEGTENIPQNCPVIFAPNHQNALMDPLVLHFAARMQTVFLARADIFKVPALNKFFLWLKMVPVYRIRDGAENLQSNEATFRVSVEVLEHRRSIGIFPEAAHNNQRRLLPLKKGVPRLAFLAESKNDFSLGVQVVPVGIHYSDYQKMHSVVHVRFGEPIEVAKYRQEYVQNQQKAMMMLRDEITGKISELAINIRDTQRYDTIYKTSELLAKPLLLATGNKPKSPKARFAAQLSITRILQQDSAPDSNQAGTLMKQTENLLTQLANAKIRSLDLGIKPDFLKLALLKIGMLLLLPVYVYGAINGIPKSLFLQLLLRKFKDRQFHSSVKFLWGMVVAPLFFLGQAGLVWGFTGSFFIALAYLASLPLTVIFSKMYRIWFELFLSACRTMYLRFFQPRIYNQLYSAYKTALEGLANPLHMG